MVGIKSIIYTSWQIFVEHRLHAMGRFRHCRQAREKNKVPILKELPVSIHLHTANASTAYTPRRNPYVSAHCLTRRSTWSLKSSSLCRVLVSMTLKQGVHTPSLALLRKNQHLGRLSHQLGSLPTLSFEKEEWGEQLWEVAKKSVLGFHHGVFGRRFFYKGHFEQWKKNPLKRS